MGAQWGAYLPLRVVSNEQWVVRSSFLQYERICTRYCEAIDLYNSRLGWAGLLDGVRDFEGSPIGGDSGSDDAVAFTRRFRPRWNRGD